MSGSASGPNTQYLPPVPPPQRPLAAQLAAMLPRLTTADKAVVLQAIAVIASGQPASYPP